MVTWAQVKAKEKAGSQERRMDVPLAFPALYRSEKLQKKAAEVGFDWEQSEAVRQKILEELGEVDEAISEADKVHLKEEMGDLLFAVVNWSRFHLSLIHILPCSISFPQTGPFMALPPPRVQSPT